MRKKILIYALCMSVVFSNFAGLSITSRAEESNSEEDVVVTTEEINEDTSEISEDLTEVEEDVIELETTEGQQNIDVVEQSLEDLNSIETTECENTTNDLVTEEDINEEILTESMMLLSSSVEDNNIININSQEDWDDFISLQSSVENPECVWSNTAGSIVYNGDENEITIQFNTDINIGTVSFTDGNTTTPTTIKLRTNNCSITNSTITVNDTLDINNTSISDSAITFSLSGDRTINGVVLTNTDLLYLNNSPIIMTVNNCTFNNSHITVERAGGTLNISNSNFNGNTKSVLTVDRSQGEVLLTLDNITGTNCHADFISNSYRGINIQSINGLNISTNDSGLHGIYGEYGSGIAPFDFKNSTIDGFDYGVYIGEADVNKGSSPAVWDNISFLNFANTGIFIRNTNSSNGFTIKNCTITGTEYAEYGIYFQAGGNSDGWQMLFNEQYSSMRCIDNCDISNCNFGVYTTQSSALVKDCNIHNVNSGIRTSSGSCAAIRCTLTAKDEVDEDSFGIAQFGGVGCELVDCDVTGFYIGAANAKPTGGSGGSVSAYGCNFIDNKECGICGYSSTAQNCYFFGSTKIMFDSVSAPNNFNDCTFVGDGTNIGAQSNSVYLYINEPTNYNLAASFAQFSDRDLSLGKTEISNFKIGLKGVEGAGIYATNVDIHDCDTGIQCENGYLFTKGYDSIKDCSNGIIFRTYFPSGEILVDNCNVGIQDDYDTDNQINHTSSQQGGGIITIKNCDIGYIQRDNYSLNCGTTFTLENNRIGMILQEGNSANLYYPITFKNNSEIGIKYINTKVDTYTGKLTPIRITAPVTINNENQSFYIDGLIYLFGDNLSVSGNSECYLASSSSYLVVTAPNTMGSYKLTFDMPNADYQEGRIVAEVKENYLDNLFAEKEGWIVVRADDTDSVYYGEEITLYKDILTAGCLVTYDYVTNGGTSISGTVTGSDMISSNDINSYDKWKYRNGNPIDLSPVAVKDGYEFVGWNTDPNATEGLTSLTAGTTNITLYAIYKTTKAVTYHTFNSNDDFTQNVDFYNNQTSVTSQLAPYGVATHDLYSFVGYVLDENESDLENNILSEGDDFNVSDSCLDVYCVYDTQSVLTYKDVDNSTITTDTTDIRGVSVSIATVVFRFILINHVSVDGYTFDGWLDSEGVMHDAGTQYIITDHAATVKAVESEIYVDSITVTPKESTILIGKTVALTATVTPDNALNKDIVWSVDDDGIATVDRNGVVTGVSVGEVTVTATNQRSGKSDTATVKVVRAETQKPVISISNDYKVTLTAGEVTNDTLDKIYYRINEGEWQEYKEPFPVYKKYTVEAYQVTKVRHVESDKVSAEGIEYATGITAEYIGEDKYINEDVTNPEVIVTVHYPNSPDEIVTNFTLKDYTIKEEGPNEVTVEYNEYPEDTESPTFTSTIIVQGIPITQEPNTRIVTIKGILKYSDGTPIANKTIKLGSLEENIIYGGSDNKSTVIGAASMYITTTDEKGNYEFKDIYVGEYELSIWDNNVMIASCDIVVSAPEVDDDIVSITDKRDDVSVDYNISGDIIKINATITPPNIPELTTEEKPEPTKIETPPTIVENPKPEAPKTGDNTQILYMICLMICSIFGIIKLKQNKKSM